MRIALLGLMMAAVPAAAQKVSVLPFTGPSASSVRNVVVSGICVEPLTCVAPAKVAAGYKADWKKAKKEKLQYFIAGKVVKKGARSTLELSLLNKAGPPKLKKSYLLTNGELSEKALGQATAAFFKAMGVDAAAPPPEEKVVEPVPEEKPTRREPPPDEKPAVSDRSTRRDEPVSPPTEPPEARSDPEMAPPADKIKDPIVALEAGLFFGGRSFSYANVTTPNLRSYSAPFMIAPTFKLEFYPLALALKGAIAGIGIEGGYQFAVGLKSRRQGTDVTYPTSATRLDVGLRWRLRPIATSNAAIIPFVGFRLQGFSVGAASDGTTLDGLPAISYSSIRPGIAGELPFSNSGFSVFGKFAVMIVLSSGQIISADYFKSGSAFGIEGQLGVGYTIVGPLSIRASFDFTRYGLTFKTDPAMDTYVAEGAADLYIGGTVSARIQF